MIARISTIGVLAVAMMSTALYADIYDVTQDPYNCTPGDTIPDSGGIQDAIDACIDDGGGMVYCPAGKYLLDEQLTIFPDSSYVRALEFSAYGAEFVMSDTLSSSIMVVGGSGERTRDIHLRGGLYAYSALNWSTGKPVIDEYNASRCTFRDIRLKNGDIGLRLKADGSQGVAYNLHENVCIDNCKYGYWLLRSGNSAWVNDNVFYSGYVSYGSALEDSNLSSYYAIFMYVVGSEGSVPNNNRFYNVSLEAHRDISNPPSGVHVDGKYNSFIHLRYEGFDSPIFSLRSLDSEYNDILLGRGLLKSSDAIADSCRLVTRVFSTSDVSLGGGSSTHPPLRITNRNSQNTPSLQVFNSSLTSQVAGISLYGNGSILYKPASAPSSPAEGTVYYDQTLQKLRYYNGSAWVNLD